MESMFLICATFWIGIYVPLEREKIKSRIEILSPGGDRSCTGSASFRLRSPSILIKEGMVMMVMVIMVMMIQSLQEGLHLGTSWTFSPFSAKVLRGIR